MPAPGKLDPIDAVDDANDPVGVVPRGQALEQGANFRTVHILLFAPDGRLLLQRLAAERQRHPGLWGSSVAGYLHAGESYEDAARRRTREELGADPALTDLGIVRMRDRHSTKFVRVFRAPYEGASIGLPDHIATLALFAPDEIDDMAKAPEPRLTPTLLEIRRQLRLT